MDIVKYELMLLFTRAAISNTRAACGPVEGFVWPSLGFRCSEISCILTTHPYFEFDIFVAGSPQCYFITSAVGIRTLTLALAKLPLQLGFEHLP